MKRCHTCNEAANEQPTIEVAASHTTKLFKWLQPTKGWGGSYSLLLVACNWKNEVPPPRTAHWKGNARDALSLHWVSIRFPLGAENLSVDFNSPTSEGPRN